MLNKELLKKIRKIEIKIRKMVESTFAGEYHSAFKGQGLEFDEVRPYQYGDDIRSIDWNVTAKTGQVFIKKFREEREQTLFVLFDVSGSENFGVNQENKLLIGTEIASILAFSALKNNDKIGLATFTDQIEKLFKPGKGRKHILAIVRSLLTSGQMHLKTNINHALEFVLKSLKRKSILIIISDFIDQNYERSLIQLSRKHEVILIRLYNPKEILESGSGIIPIVDMESGRMSWLNAANTGARQKLQTNFLAIDRNLEQLAKKYKIGYMSVNTSKDYIPVLERFFKEKNRPKRKRQGGSR